MIIIASAVELNLIPANNAIKQSHRTPTCMHACSAAIQLRRCCLQ